METALRPGGGEGRAPIGAFLGDGQGGNQIQRAGKRRACPLQNGRQTFDVRELVLGVVDRRVKVEGAVPRRQSQIRREVHPSGSGVHRVGGKLHATDGGESGVGQNSG